MASNTIIQCASSSSLSLLPKYAYDVFVSFRGEDTRNNFTAFLFQALSRNGIDVFKDNQDLKKGEFIAPELLQAIQGSRLFVVVFSKNYASSTWCLRELVHICNCIQTSSRQLLPIFYDVDPSEVRKQNGSYEKAFVEHEERLIEDKEKLEELQKWRQALTQVSNLSGWDIRNKPQHVMLDEIVQRITNILGPKFSSLPNDNLVGMESRVEELAKLLHSGSINDVRVIGITGMSGIGKTALACDLYERISHHYDSHCFIDVSRIYRDSSTLGVQKQLLSQSLNEKSLEICNVSEGTFLVWTRLRNAKRLIVFDNVDKVEQLKMFSGNRGTLLRECLGGGSRIIIVSRDEQILRTYQVDHVYQVQPLNLEDANQLFCRYAFKSNYIVSDYEMLIHGVLSHAHGHPLVIEVIGNSLFGKGVSYWTSVLTRLRKNMSKDIMAVLRIAFEELEDTNKEIFLDIACFFSGYGEQYVKEVLDFRGFNPEYGLQVLIDKSLITIAEGRIQMPNLLSDLGKSIVKEESPREPRKWSRVWNYPDLLKVMSDNMEETNIEAIVITYFAEEMNEIPMRVDALAKLRNLKLLRLHYNSKYSGSINDLSNELGYIYWYNYPCHCLPQSFQPHKLVQLILYGSNIKQLWKDIKPLHHLKLLDLSHSEKLVKLQNFGEAVNLEILNLRGCIKLKQIDDVPKNLTNLNLQDCGSLVNLPHFRDALNLEVLNFKGCSNLRHLDPSIGLLKKLTYLSLKDCKSLVSLPKNILELNSLEYLSLSGCSQLYNNQLLEEPRDAEHSKKLCIIDAPSHSQSSSSILNKIITWILPSYSKEQKVLINWLLPSMPILSCMRELDLSFCNLLKVPDAVGNLYSLERLCLRGNNFVILPSLKELSKLIYLNLEHCKRLENLPELPSQTNTPLKNHTTGPFSNPHDIPEFDEGGLGLNVFNCPELGKRESSRSMCFTWMMQIVKAYHPHAPCLSSIIAGSEIPRWFNNQRECIDNSIRIDASHVVDKNNWIGVACCALFSVSNQRRMGSPRREPPFRYSIPLFFRADLLTDESDHLWLFYFTQSDFIFLCGYNKELEHNIGDSEGYAVEVKKYGHRVIYKEDLPLSNFTMIHTQTSLSRKRKLTEIEGNE